MDQLDYYLRYCPEPAPETMLDDTLAQMDELVADIDAAAMRHGNELTSTDFGWGAEHDSLNRRISCQGNVDVCFVMDLTENDSIADVRAMFVAKLRDLADAVEGGKV